jgi:hypothetical protein
MLETRHNSILEEPAAAKRKQNGTALCSLMSILTHTAGIAVPAVDIGSPVILASTRDYSPDGKAFIAP